MATVTGQSDLISTSCKVCGFTFKVKARFAGKIGKCPNPDCGQPFRVPKESTEPETANGQPARESRPPRQQAARRKPARARKRSPLRRVGRRAWWIGASVTAALLVAATTFLIVKSSADDEPSSAGTDAASTTAQLADPNRKLSRAEIAAEKKRRSSQAMTEFRDHVAPFLKKHCIDCHGADEQSAEIAFHTFKDLSGIRKRRRVWERVTRVLESGIMPPKDHDVQPSEKDSKRVVKWIDDLFRVDCRLVDDPGRVTIRRLNRAEYNNTIRDLLGVDFEPAKDFPSDDVGYGFDNIGDVLSLPPLLMEKYLNAAEAIAEKAIVVSDPKKLAQKKSGRQLTASKGVRRGRGDFYQLSSSGNVSARFDFPRTGEYLLRAEAAADQAGKELAKMEFRLDGRKVKVFEVKGRRRPGRYEIKVRVEKGTRRFAAAFINDYYNPKARNPRDRDRNLAVRFLEVRGPIGLPPANLSPTHKRIFIARPGPKKSPQQAAREILTPLATRAFRRPATPDEIDRLLRLVEFVLKQGDSFERGIQVALQSILVSPHFLFRVESDQEPNNADAQHSIKDYELATRLSYFLWSSMPDDELFRLAGRGELHKPEVLERQVRRMLNDPKSAAITDNFASQWLNLRILDEVTPDRKRFPGFNEKLRADMRRETELFFTAVMRENRSILDFLDGKFTFLNERLAKHYGISGVKGNDFRRVAFNGPVGKQRAGVLTHASILTITSNATRTSPVMRGKWILVNIFDTPPPPPPPGVPELDEEKIAAGDLSLRKQLEIHRKNPVCASCHNQMDPLGFGFENFNPVGRWREKDGKNPIDSSGVLPSGARFRGPIELVGILKRRKSDFAQCFTKKMLTFALGRGLEDYDMCTVDEIVKRAAKDDYRFVTIVTEIVKSKPFLMRRGDNSKAMP